MSVTVTFSCDISGCQNARARTYCDTTVELELLAAAREGWEQHMSDDHLEYHVCPKHGESH